MFNNTYVPKPAEIVIEGTKNLTGKNLTAGLFNFVLTECDDAWNPIDNGIYAITPNTENGTFVFDKLVYDKVGTHYFTVTENIPDEKKGITYDKTITGSTNNSIVFNNDYNAKPVPVVINGIKNLEGRNIADPNTASFRFQLYATDDNWVMGNQIGSDVTCNSDGSFSFDLGEFGANGTHHYIVKEVVPDPVPDGYTYDEKEVRVTVTITDNLEGNFVADITYKDVKKISDDAGNITEEVTDVAAVVFNNTYKITGEADVIIEGLKIFEKYSLKDNKFTFILSDHRMESLKIAQNDENGRFSFSIHCDPSFVGKTTTYYVTERNENKQGIIYDETIYKIEVTAEDNNRGGIAVSVTVNGEAYDPDKEQIVFKNYFHFEPPEKPKPTPEEEEIIATGGDMNVSLLAALTTVSVIGIATSFAAGKKKK